MPPTRTHDNGPAEAEASTSKLPKKTHHERKQQPYQVKESAFPSLQKLKSSLRQTRRLLAKDKLAADKRVEGERRLKALDEELQHAELAHKERALAVRYHKIKFFERQKVGRKLKQTKKRLSSATDSERKNLLKELLECRINLNYILHYPKLKKYISLFPPEVRKDDPGLSSTSQTELDKTSKEREEIRTRIRESMEKHELPEEPELQLDSKVQGNATLNRDTTRFAEWSSNLELKASSSSKIGKNKSPTPEATASEDDFFVDDREVSDDDGDSSGP